MYEKNYFQKEIHFCKSFKTPELDEVLSKANLAGDLESQHANNFKLNLERGKITKAKYQEMTRYLENILTQRRELAQQLELQEKARKAKENEYKHKQDLIAEFPQLL